MLLMSVVARLRWNLRHLYDILCISVAENTSVWFCNPLFIPKALHLTQRCLNLNRVHFVPWGDPYIYAEWCCLKFPIRFCAKEIFFPLHCWIVLGHMSQAVCNVSWIMWRLQLFYTCFIPWSLLCVQSPLFFCKCFEMWFLMLKGPTLE